MRSVSIIIPCLNEERYIKKCIDSLVHAGQLSNLEIIVVDGMSGDKTRGILYQMTKKIPFLKVLDNPKKSTPHALNIGIEHASGEVVMRMDAHCTYPEGYVSRLLTELEESGADNVGGVWRSLPGSNSDKSLAVSLATSDKFCVGNAHYRIGQKKKRYVDTVPFGCYLKSTLLELGGFDEEMVRNQDDELNARLISRGGRILLLPDVVIDYFCRENISRNSHMFFQYGFFKPLGNYKSRRVSSLRQLGPGGFIIFQLIGLGLGINMSEVFILTTSVMVVYLLTMLGRSLAVYQENIHRFKSRFGLFWLLSTFVTTHYSYGLGYLLGILALLSRSIGGPNFFSAGLTR